MWPFIGKSIRAQPTDWDGDGEAKRAEAKSFLWASRDREVVSSALRLTLTDWVFNAVFFDMILTRASYEHQTTDSLMDPEVAEL